MTPQINREQASLDKKLGNKLVNIGQKSQFSSQDSNLVNWAAIE